MEKRKIRKFNDSFKRSTCVSENLVGLKINIEFKNIEISKRLKNTISSVKEKNWIAMKVIVEEKRIKTILPKLKRIEAERIIEYYLNRIIFQFKIIYFKLIFIGDIL